MAGAAVVQVVAVVAGNHDVLQAHSRRHIRNLCGLGAIKIFRLALRHGAKPAAPRADITQNHERRRAAPKAVVNVRAARRLAHCVQMARSELDFQLVQRAVIRAALAEPLRQPW
jgi:hypothetical protein